MTGTLVTVVDDEASTVITAGAIVTVFCSLARRNMSSLFGDETAPDKHCAEDKTELEPEAEDKKEEQVCIGCFSIFSLFEILW